MQCIQKARNIGLLEALTAATSAVRNGIQTTANCRRPFWVNLPIIRVGAPRVQCIQKARNVGLLEALTAATSGVKTGMHCTTHCMHRGQCVSGMTIATVANFTGTRHRICNASLRK